MKKINQLSRNEMKIVTGGGVAFGGCTDDSGCPAGQSCCPDHSSGGSTLEFKCSSPGLIPLPDGTMGMDNCPN